MALKPNNGGSDDVQTVTQLLAPRPNTTGPQKSEYSVTDPVLDPGVRPMPRFEELQLTDGGVGHKCLVAPSIDLFKH